MAHFCMVQLSEDTVKYPLQVDKSGSQQDPNPDESGFTHWGGKEQDLSTVS